MNPISSAEIAAMDYVSFMGFLNETNRPPGGKDSIRRMVINSFLTKDSHVLHSGCNTGYCSFEICHLIKCKVSAIDFNQSMLQSALAKLDAEPSPYRELITFQKGDAHQLNFKDETFDLVMSGGSTAFMRDKEQVVKEYARVCKPYGFVGDVFLYYHENPPQSLIETINEKLQIEIKKWDRNYWTSLYASAGLEEYYMFDSKMEVQPTDADVLNYCEKIVAPLTLSKEAHLVALEKLHDYMHLFNENHRYLSYAVLLYRKVPQPEQEALFGI